MRNSLGKLALAAGAAAAVVVLGATTATAGVAAPTWTVGPNASETFSATAGTVTLTLNGIPMTCTSSAAQGNLASASGTTGVTVGTIAPLSWSGCTSPFGPVTPTADTSTAWKLNANTYSAGVTNGYISGVKATLKVLTCTFTVTGDVVAKYTNSTGVLAVSNDATYKLTVATASAGCAGIAKVGDNPTYTTNYNAVTPSGGTTKPTIVYTP